MVGACFTVSWSGVSRVGWFQCFGLVMFGAPGPPFQDRPSQDRGPPSRTAQNFALFSRPPPQNSFFSSLSGCLIVEFGAGTHKCARLGSLVVVKKKMKRSKKRRRKGFIHKWQNNQSESLWRTPFPPSPPTLLTVDFLPLVSGPPGFHTTTRELQTCTFERPDASNTTKIPREDTQRESEFFGGRGKKKREILARRVGAHPSGPHPWGPRPHHWSSHPLDNPSPSTPTHLAGTTYDNSTHTKKPEQLISKNSTINSQKPKSLHTTETLTLAKVGLAKVGFDRPSQGGPWPKKTRHEQRIVPHSSPIGQCFGVKFGSQKVRAQKCLIKASGLERKLSGPKVVRKAKKHGKQNMPNISSYKKTKRKN